jgi:C4-dicarboxylate-specific signal transduction histidine kinase
LGRTGEPLSLEMRAVKTQWEGKEVFLASFRDVTKRKMAEKEREEMQEQLRQAQKMEAIGTLSGGIAHDFNNILSAIIGYSELCLAEVEEESLVANSIREVLKAGRRASELVKQILLFSRQHEQEKKPIMVYLIAKEAIKLLRASIPTTVDIRHYIESKSLIMGDPTQVHQILMNLCTNAAHAMAEHGGTLEVLVKGCIHRQRTDCRA